MIPIPRHMEFNDWASACIDSIHGLKTFPVPNGEMQWRDWAQTLLTDKVFDGKQIVWYNNVVRWQEWADSLVHAMGNDI